MNLTQGVVSVVADGLVMAEEAGNVVGTGEVKVDIPNTDPVRVCL